MKRSVSAVMALVAVLSGVGGEASAAPSLIWRDCHTDDTPARLECATLRVPLDWSRPDGTKITLALNRLPATDPAHQVGPLLINPGGPGGSGTAVVAQGGMFLGSPELKPVLERFDVVGFDPRGAGESTPVRCSRPVYDPAALTAPATAAAYRRMIAAGRRHGADCARTTGRLIAHVDTISAARDVEAIRAALGAPKVSWLGVSYGTELGAAYARLYPGRIRAMVLDGAVDHGRSVAQDSREESAAIEREFTRFAAWCQAEATCPLRGQDIAARFDALTARTDLPITPAEITAGTYTYLTMTFLWPQLADALAAAEKTPSDVTALSQALPGNDPGYTAYRAIGCHDFPPRLRGFTDLRSRVAEAKAAAPHMWRYSEFWDWTSGCAGWPVRPADPPKRQHITGAPPILVVGNTYDPSTPYAWAQGLAGQIAGSRLLTYDGDGHTALYNSACARTHEADYLVTTATPPPGTVCT